MDYVKSKEWKFVNFYIDDGYSGTDFDRPALTKLLSDMKDDKFNVLLIKDLSRLGGKAYKVGDLVENVFPENKIRVISVYDNYDSQNPDNDEYFVLKSLLNDYYMKEFKIKSKQVRDYNANHKHLNFFPKYGYNFNEKNEEIIDEYSAGIVKKIFDYNKWIYEYFCFEILPNIVI